MIEGRLELVVEGPGDVNATPPLLSKIALAEGFELPTLGRPIPVLGRGKATRDRGLEGFVATAAARPNCGAVLVLLDGEGDAVCQLGPALLARAQAVTDKPVLVALADPMFEAWITASAETLGLQNLTYNNSRSDPVAGLRRALGNRKYAKPIWQPRLTDRIDAARVKSRSHSFARLSTRLATLIAP